MQQGALNVGNTQQNMVNLLAICRASANGAATFARWSTAVNRKIGTAQPVQALYVYPALVPGFVNPIGLQDPNASVSFLTDNLNDPLTDNSGNLLTE